MKAVFEPIVGRYMHLDLFGRPHRIYVEDERFGFQDGLGEARHSRCGNNQP